jgi:hypothetical protein
MFVRRANMDTIDVRLWMKTPKLPNTPLRRQHLGVQLLPMVDPRIALRQHRALQTHPRRVLNHLGRCIGETVIGRVAVVHIFHGGDRRRVRNHWLICMPSKLAS